MRRLAFLFSLLLIVPAARAADSGERRDVPDENVIRWGREFAKTYGESKTWPELLGKMPHVPTEARLQLIRIFGDRKLPKLTVVDPFTYRFDSTELKILSLKNRDFRFDGKYLKVPAGSRFTETVKLFSEARAAREARLRYWLDLLLMPSANAEMDKRLLPLKDALWNDPTRALECEMCYLALGIPGAGIALGGGLTADYLLTKAESFLAKSCDRQMKELTQLLRETKLALSEMDCGETYRGSDREIGFWQANPKDPGGEPIKREFSYDYRASALQENPPEDDEDEAPKKKKKSSGDEGSEAGKKAIVLYKFGIYGNDSLKEVRVLADDARGRAQRKDYKPKDAEFRKYSKSIEPISKVMIYLGKNRTCDKCSDEIEALVVSKPPDHVREAPASAPAASSADEGTR